MKTATDTPLLTNISAEWLKGFSTRRKEPDWLLAFRLQAFEAYQKLPWPTLRDERWKRANLKALNWSSLRFSPTVQNELGSENDGVFAGTFETFVEKHPALVKAFYSNLLMSAAGNKFLLLNLALANGGHGFVVSKNAAGPVSITANVSPSPAGTASFPVQFVVLEEGTTVSYWNEMKEPFEKRDASFLATTSWIHIGANASLSHYTLQEWSTYQNHFQFQDIQQDSDSRLNAIAVSLGGQLFHNESTFHLNGDGAQNKVLGILFGDDKQNIENWMKQYHNAKRTVSDIQFRGALKGQAKSFFSGLVSIVKEAQQSDAYQSAKSLILSKDARADAIPNLEILADDVKCSHGAAVAPVDEDQKFYLQTRGFTPDAAEELIVQGFFEPVIAEIPSDPIQEKLRSFIEKKLLN